MRKSILVLLVFICLILAVPTNGFTEINGPISDGATQFIWTCFVVPIVGLAAIPFLKRRERKHWIREALKQIHLN